MILRALTLAGGILGAAFAAQGPGFARAYVVELMRAEQTLSRVVAEFDQAAEAAGLSREAALARLRGSALLERRRVDLVRNFHHLETLTVDLPLLQDAGPFLRSYHMLRAADPEALRSSWRGFSPTVPRNRADLLFAAIGFIAGLLVTKLILWLPTWPGRARRCRALRP